MTRTLAPVLLVVSLASSGCAGAASTSAGKAPDGALASGGNKVDKTVCRMERPLGSNIAQMVCRRQSDIDQSSLDAQDALRARPKSGPTPRGN